MNLFDQILNQAKLGTPGQFSGGTSFGSINTQDFQSKAPAIQKSIQAEQNLRNQGFSDKEVRFLKLQKEKGVDMNQAFAFVEQKRQEEAQAKNAPTNFDMAGGAISEIPKVAGETASWMSNMGAYTPMAMASAAIRAPFSDKTYGQLREEQKNAGQVFSDIGQKGKESIQSTGLYNPNSTGAKIGEGITDIGSTFLGPNKAKIFKEGAGVITKYAPKALNLAQEGATMGAKYDIATKGEITKEGAGYGALGNLVFGGAFGSVKRGYDVVKNQLPASLTLGGLINPGKLDIVKKSLQVDEGVATPQDVGKWILDRVKPGNKQEIADQLIKHAEKTKGAVDEALASIPTYFKNPEAKKALLQIRSELEGKAGLEGKLAKVDELLAKPDYTLSELNAVKRELDDMYNLYTKTGDPTAGLKAEGLRNIRANIRGFIEKEADKYGVNIRKLNNETAVARGLADGILRKDSADGVRELLTAFAPSGAGAAIGAGQAIARGEDPLTVLRDALIGGIATKIGTSTAVRTRIASALNNLSAKELTALQSYIRSGGKDAIGKKVAEKVIKEGRALPARTLTKETDFAKPVEKAIITPQTQERAIIEQSKKGLSSNVKRPNGNTNNNLNNTGNISVGSKKIQKSSSKVNPEKTVNTNEKIDTQKKVYKELGYSEGKWDTLKPIKYNGKVVGGIDTHIDKFYPKRMNISYIRILPQFQGKGLGTDAIKQLFKDNPNIDELVGHSTAEAMSFWKKQTIEFTGVDKNIFIIKKSDYLKSKQISPQKTKQNLTPKKESATMGDMETKKLTEEARSLGKYDGSYDVTKGKKLYRGGNEDGVFWTDDIDIAKSFGDEGVVEKIITMKKPLDVRSKAIREYIKKNTDINIDNATSAYSRSLPEFKKLTKWAKENGYDGIIGKTSDNGLNFTGNEFVTLSSPKPLSPQKTVKPKTRSKNK